MAYNPYQFYSNQQPQYNFQASQQMQHQGGIIWVQGEAGAKSYLVAPNTTVALWDSEDKIIYLKSADASGMPNIKTIDYTIRGDSAVTHASTSENDFATLDYVHNLESKIDALESKIERLNARRTTTKKEVKDE